MIYFLFHTARQYTFFLAIGASIGTIVMLVLFLLTAGRSIRTSAGGGKPSRLSASFRFLMVIFASVAVASLASTLFGETAIQRAPPGQETPNAIIQFIVGPDTIETRRALLFAAVTFMAVFTTTLGLVSQTAQGSALRLWMDRLRGINRKQEIHGSSHFATLEEYKRFRKNQRGGVSFYGKFHGDRQGKTNFTYLGDQFNLSAEDAARGIITIGNPGSGKSSSVILPLIYDSMRRKQNLVVTDPQLELRDKIATYAAITGHRVIIHDPTSKSLPRFNLASGIKKVSQAKAVANVLIPKDGGSTDGFWTKSSQNLLAACLLRYNNLGDIYTDFGDIKKMATILGEQNDDAQRLAGSFISSISDGDSKTALNVIATLSTSLSGWADGAVRDSTEKSDFLARDLVDPDRPTVVVLACPGAEREIIAPYLGAVLTKLLLDLDTIGERTDDGQLPIPVKFVLEEFPALGDLRSVVDFANLVRKRRISFIIACQTIGQLENIYGKNGCETLLAGMAFQIIFGGCDPATARYYSDVAGTGTVAQTKEDGKVQERQRKLLTADEIIRPPEGNCTIFGRYVTADYATYVIVLSRLTRIYERIDVREATGKVDKKKKMKRVMPRGRADRVKRKEKPKHQVMELPTNDEISSDNVDDEQVIAAAATTNAPVIDKPRRRVVVKPIGVID
ncbi:MAG: type IV secretory system conjugative DNA transfer family protein [Chloroflexota bacterium]